MLAEPQALHARLLHTSTTCAAMGAPFYAALLEYAAGDLQSNEPVRGLLERHQTRSGLGLRFLAAAHFRALCAKAERIARHFPSTGGDGNARAAWDAICDDVRAASGHYDELLAEGLQTNEPARAMPLLAALLWVAHRAPALPIRLFELGASAGLLLRLDRYRYEGAGWSWGEERSPLHLHNRSQGETIPRHLDAPLRIVQRSGCDLNPLDASDPVVVRRLLSFIWADQHERFTRLQAALEIAAGLRVAIDRADALEWLAGIVPQDGTTSVIMHSVVMEHLQPAQRTAWTGAIAQMGARARRDAPVAWVRFEQEAEGYAARATFWPAGEECVIARSDGHAQGLRWESSSA